MKKYTILNKIEEYIKDYEEQIIFYEKEKDTHYFFKGIVFGLRLAKAVIEINGRKEKE